MGLTNNSARIIIRTVFMERIPNNIMGRVQTIFGVYTRLMVIASSLLAGWIVEFVDIKNAMLFSSLHFLTALIGTLITARIWVSHNIFTNEDSKSNA